MIDQAYELKVRMQKPPQNLSVYAVVSGKGGVGKSNITLNLGLALCQAGKRVLLIDGDLGMANLDILAGVMSRTSLMDYFERHKSLDEILVHYQNGLDILPGGSGFMNLRENREDEIRDFVSRLMGDGHYDYVFIDAGAGVDTKLLSFVSVAHEVLLITVPEPTAMIDAYSLIKILSVYEIKPRLHLIVNQVSSRREAQETYDHLNKVIHTFLNIQMDLLGYVRSDAKVKEGVHKQVPFLLSHPGAMASQNIKEICGRLLNREVPRTLGSLHEVMRRFVKIFGA